LKEEANTPDYNLGRKNTHLLVIIGRGHNAEKEAFVHCWYAVCMLYVQQHRTLAIT